MPAHKIFLYASTHGLGKDIHVRLRLRNEWCCIASFPVSVCSKQEIRWHVQGSCNGEIQELEHRKYTGPYLFYETLINPQLPLPVSDMFGVNSDSTHMNHCGAVDWIPNMPKLCNGTEMRKRRAEFIDYIDGILSNVFQLDCRQRTDFITSLLGTLLYELVLFRFLSKDELQSAANLSLYPSPGLAIRVFLLYGPGEKAGEASTYITGSTTLQNASCSGENQLTAIPASGKAALPDLGLEQALQDSSETDTRETDWGSLVIGPRSSSVSSDFQDPGLFKLLEYASFEVKA